CGRPRLRPQTLAPFGTATRQMHPSMFTTGLVCILRQISQRLKERGRLTDEESHAGEEVDDAHGSSPGFRGTDDGAWRQLAADERARFRHDEVGLEGLTAEGSRVQVRERHGYAGYGVLCSKRRRIARFVGPGLEVHGFGGSYADENAQDLDAGGPLRHGGIQAVAPLLDGGHMEAGSVGDGLKEVRIGGVGVSARTRSVLADSEGWHSLGEREVRIEVRVVLAAAIAR